MTVWRKRRMIFYSHMGAFLCFLFLLIRALIVLFCFALAEKSLLIDS